jgi:hypothetical protein
MADGPLRIQRRRIKGWQMPAGAVYVGRPTRFGNPFDLRAADHCWTAIAHGFKGDRKGRVLASVAIYRAWLQQGKPAEIGECGLYDETGQGDPKPISTSPLIAAGAPPTAEEIAELRGKDLACWCRLDQPCHADVLLDLANR